MSEINDGGPAFPRSHAIADANDPSFKLGHAGMSLRDYFAAKALLAVTANDHVDGQSDPERHSALAYAYADAMLKVRR